MEAFIYSNPDTNFYESVRTGIIDIPTATDLQKEARGKTYEYIPFYAKLITAIVLEGEKAGKGETYSDKLDMIRKSNINYINTAFANSRNPYSQREDMQRVLHAVGSIFEYPYNSTVMNKSNQDGITGLNNALITHGLSDMSPYLCAVRYCESAQRISLDELFALKVKFEEVNAGIRLNVNIGSNISETLKKSDFYFLYSQLLKNAIKKEEVNLFGSNESDIIPYWKTIVFMHNNPNTNAYLEDKLIQFINDQKWQEFKDEIAHQSIINSPYISYRSALALGINVYQLKKEDRIRKANTLLEIQAKQLEKSKQIEVINSLIDTHLVLLDPETHIVISNSRPNVYTIAVLSGEGKIPEMKVKIARKRGQYLNYNVEEILAILQKYPFTVKEISTDSEPN